MVARDVAELVRRSRPRTSRTLNGRRRACPTARRGGSGRCPSPRRSAATCRSRRPARRTGIEPTCSRCSSSRPPACSCGSRSFSVGTQVRRDEREQQREAGERGHGRDPPPVADSLREAHHDRERDAEEHELSAEREPAAGDRLDVALVDEVVPSRPPEAEHLERQLRQPQQREADHARAASRCRSARPPTRARSAGRAARTRRTPRARPRRRRPR